MDYPREIYLSEEREQALRLYLDNEIVTHRGERSQWVQDLQAWQEDYWATPSAKEATFPFKGAANTIIPLTAIAVEAMHAREITTLFALPQFVTCKITDPTKQSARSALEQTIDFELLKGCNIRKFADTALLENKKLGSCIGKVSYEKVVKTAIREEGGEEVEFEVITSQGPVLHSVPVANYLQPFTATDPQNSPWCGEEHLENVYEVEQRIKSGFFRPETKEWLKSWLNQGQDLSSQPYTDSLRAQQDQKPVQYPREISWYEMWLAFDVDGDDNTQNPILGPGKLKEIVVHYHWPSRKFLSVRYNWNADLHRDYRIGNYFPVEHRWAGIGIAKQNEQFQEMATTIQRQRLDNATLANMRMFKAKQGSGIGPNEPLYPGRIFLVEDVNDFEAIVGGSEVYPSGYNDEQSLVVYSQQRTGVNELSLGMPQAGTPGTATSDMTRVQEYNRKTDYTFSNSKIFLNQIVMDVLCAQSQFGFRDRRYLQQLGTNAQLVEEFLTMPPEDIRSQIFFETQLIGSSANKLVDRNNWTQYSGMLTQYYVQMVQLAQATGQQQVIQIVMAKAVEAATEAMRQISEGFDIRQVDRLLLPEQLIQLIGGMQSGSPQLPPGGSTDQATPGTQQGTGVQ